MWGEFDKERLTNLYAQAELEQDPEKLLSLVQKINNLLRAELDYVRSYVGSWGD